MDQLNDLIFAKLSAFNGDTLNERLLSWLKSEGATSDQLNEAWHQFWDAKLITQADSFNDRQYLWLLSEGVTGSDQVNDMQMEFWESFV